MKVQDISAFDIFSKITQNKCEKKIIQDFFN